MFKLAILFACCLAVAFADGDDKKGKKETKAGKKQVVEVIDLLGEGEGGGEEEEKKKSLSTSKNAVHSRAYKKELRRLKGLGKAEAECKAGAQQAGRKAVEGM